ncbi:succinate-semialdehyde dehydrogenase [Aspergillus sclerotiicarbonarius CBS 121057]|uniref:succinate-semialdehyde dehydrogenase [NAD(P)(+)] n=1 Tax=Aspergillus sclerotiicarbonarius (strain CBS 121057 / IBT 28362) TaxID=1448318 RepID=A0A319DWA6_ASPSB|nr:succinate-semialdehyde dehydrogenase [Aspergillus sclerotiicarbonarius CBS 121057]
MANTLDALRRKDLLQTKGLIDGKWSPAATGETFRVVNPASLDVLATLPEMGAEDATQAIVAASRAFASFRTTTTARQRARWLRKWNDLVLENIDDLALILTLENGKTLQEARGEVVYGASFLEWFAAEAERAHGQVVPAANPSHRILTAKQPVGVAALLTPWNFPIAMITRKAGAALAAGCTTVWKPAGETPLSCLALAVLAQEAGLPVGSINVVLTLNKVAEVGQALCENSLVRKLSFTGSTRVGKLLAQQCSPTLKKLSLELGGNSPFILFDDAQIDHAVEALVMAKFRNSGQTCVTANRVYVQKGIYDQFAEAMLKRMQSLQVGPGTQEGVTIGPLTHERAVDKAMQHIEDAKRHGGHVLIGGAPLPDLKGYFIQPTLIRDMKPEMMTTREEIFAPVLGLYPFETEEEVIGLANNSTVGLGSFIMSENMSRCVRVAEALEVGMVGINVGMLSACESPFGGVKGSGYGREGGTQGIEDYLAVKPILLDVNH